jgi:hypothetical protein
MSDVRFLLKKVAGGNELEIQGDLSVGRGTDNGLKLTEGNPSRHHARFSMSEGALYLEDLKSTNGTFVNGTRIDRKMRLAPSDKIRFDLEEYVLRVEMPPPPPVDSDKTAMRVIDKSAVAEAAKPYVPPSWTDTNVLAAGNKTVFKSIEQMEEERKRAQGSVEAAGRLGPVSVPQLTIYDGSGPPLTGRQRHSHRTRWRVRPACEDRQRGQAVEGRGSGVRQRHLR